MLKAITKVDPRMGADGLAFVNFSDTGYSINDNIKETMGTWQRGRIKGLNWNRWAITQKECAFHDVWCARNSDGDTKG